MWRQRRRQGAHVQLTLWSGRCWRVVVDDGCRYSVLVIGDHLDLHRLEGTIGLGAMLKLRVEDALKWRKLMRRAGLVHVHWQWWSAVKCWSLRDGVVHRCCCASHISGASGAEGHHGVESVHAIHGDGVVWGVLKGCRRALLGAGDAVGARRAIAYGIWGWRVGIIWRRSHLAVG